MSAIAQPEAKAEARSDEESVGVSAHSDPIASAFRRAEELQAELHKEKARSRRLENENRILTSLLERGKNDFALFHQVEQELSERCRALDEQIRALRARQQEPAPLPDVKSIARLEARVIELQERLRASHTEIEALKDRLAANSRSTHTAHSAEDERKFHKRVAQHLRDERRLKFYALSLQREKQSIVEMAQDLHERIKQVRATNPLKDYLDVTAFEATRLETKIRATPLLSPERSKLRAALAHVTEQRSYLHGLIAESEKTLNEQSAALQWILKQEKIAFVPPPPPKIEDV